MYVYKYMCIGCIVTLLVHENLALDFSDSNLWNIHGDRLHTRRGALSQLRGQSKLQSRDRATCRPVCHRRLQNTWQQKAAGLPELPLRFWAIQGSVCDRLAEYG